MDGVPYTENIVYPPFIGAATGILNSKPSLSTPPPEQPYWRVQHVIGDGACGFRAIARHFLGDPELHHQIRQQLVQYMSENRHNNDLRIYEGINVNSPMLQAYNPILITHTTTISPKCHHHTHIWANPKSQLYRPSMANRYTFTSTKPPYLLLLLTQRMTFTYVTTAMSRHYDTFQLIIPEPVEQPHAPISGGGLSSAS